MKKKGFTLIEIVIAMALAFLMVGVVDRMLISHLKSYENSILQNNGFNYLNEAIEIIKKEVNQNVSEIKIQGNIIKINYTDGSTVNHIKCINSNLYILYGTKYKLPSNSSRKNLIIDDVKDFMVTKSGRILYIKLRFKSSQSIERCLVIENAN